MAGHILSSRRKVLEELAACNAALVGTGFTDAEMLANRDYLEEQLADWNERIDNGELSEDEAAQLLSDQYDDTDDADQHVRKAALSGRVWDVIDAAGGDWVDVDDLVEQVQGRRLSESNVGHAAVRKVISRMAWPERYADKAAPPVAASVQIRLGSHRIFDAVRAL